MKCTNCQYELGPHDSFCSNCGAKVKPNFCNQCGSRLDLGVNFCTQCGFPVAEMIEVPSEAAVVTPAPLQVSDNGQLTSAATDTLSLSDAPTSSETSTSSDTLDSSDAPASSEMLASSNPATSPDAPTSSEEVAVSDLDNIAVGNEDGFLTAETQNRARTSTADVSLPRFAQSPLEEHVAEMPDVLAPEIPEHEIPEPEIPAPAVPNPAISEPKTAADGMKLPIDAKEKSVEVEQTSSYIAAEESSVPQTQQAPVVAEQTPIVADQISAALPQAPVANQPDANQPDVEPSKKEKKKNKKRRGRKILIFLSILVLLAGGVVAFFAAQDILIFHGEFPYVRIFKEGDLPLNSAQTDLFYKKYVLEFKVAVDAENQAEITRLYRKIAGMNQMIEEQYLPPVDTKQEAIIESYSPYRAKFEIIAETNKDLMYRAFYAEKLEDTDQYKILFFTADSLKGDEDLAFLKKVVAYCREKGNRGEMMRLLGAIVRQDGAKGVALIKELSDKDAEAFIAGFDEESSAELTKAIESRDKESLIANHNQVSKFYAELDNIYADSADQSLLNLSKEMRNRFLENLRSRNLEIIRIFVEDENPDANSKRLVNDVFSLDQIQGDSGKELVSILSNYFAKIGDYEQASHLLRTAIGVYGADGVALANQIQAEIAKNYPDLKSGWEYMDLPKYHSVSSANEGYYRVTTKEGDQKRWGLIDSEGNVIIEPMYEIMGKFLEGRAAVRLNNKWGFFLA